MSNYDLEDVVAIPEDKEYPEKEEDILHIVLYWEEPDENCLVAVDDELRNDFGLSNFRLIVDKL